MAAVSRCSDVGASRWPKLDLCASGPATKKSWDRVLFIVLHVVRAFPNIISTMPPDYTFAGLLKAARAGAAGGSGTFDKAKYIVPDRPCSIKYEQLLVLSYRMMRSQGRRIRHHMNNLKPQLAPTGS